MLKRILSVVALVLTLSVVGASTVKQGPGPDPGCGLDCCQA
jgi:hypothetical protein